MYRGINERERTILNVVLSSLDELASGLPTGFIFTPTTSPGSKKLRPAQWNDTVAKTPAMA